MSAFRRGMLVRLFQVALAVVMLFGAGTWASARPGAPFFAPTFNKVDSAGALLPGATFQGWLCSKFPNDPGWRCAELTGEPWFGAALTQSGTTGDQWGQNIDSHTVGMCVVVVETNAPVGYWPAPGPVVACHGPQGWFTDPAALPETADASMYAPADGFTLDEIHYGMGAGHWTITNDPETAKSTFSLTNQKRLLPTVTINKVDENGRLLPGGVFEGLSCTRFNNNPGWSCENLSDYSWFTTGEGYEWGLTASGTTGTSLSNEIPMLGLWTTPVNHCLVLREKQPPAGYVAADAPMLVCKGPGGWTVDNAKGVQLPLDGELVSAGLGDWTVANVEDTLTTTFQLISRPILKQTPAPPVTPPPTTPVTPPTVRGIGANTGVDEPGVLAPFVIAGGALCVR